MGKPNQPRVLDVVTCSYRLNRAALFVNSVLRKFGVRVVADNSLVVVNDWVARLLYFSRLFNLLGNVSGDIVECGVADGGSQVIFATLNRNMPVKRHIWGFDSFEGLPEPGKEDMDSPRAIARKGMYAGSIASVLSNLKRAGIDENYIKENISLVKGWFADTLPDFKGSIAFLHVDGDLYESNKCVLENLWQHVVTGGIVAFDDYLDTERFPGDKKAVDDFFSSFIKNGDVKMSKDPYYHRCYIVRLK